MRQFRVVLVLVAVVAVAAGLLATRRETPPVAVSPTPTPAPTATAAPASPTPSPTPTVATAKLRVYFARDELPPVGVDVDAKLAYGTSREGRTRARFDALASADAPAGLVNPLKTLRTHPTVAAVTISADLVTVDWTVPGGDWGIGGSAATLELIQQLVYTATEESGIGRAMFTENGGKPTIIDQAQVDRPSARENVFGYGRPGSQDPLKIEGASPNATLATSVTVEKVTPGMARFVITLGGPEVAPPARISPAFAVGVSPAKDLPGKWELDVLVSGTDAATKDATIDQTPLRAIAVGRSGGVTYRLGLDDLRPWRAMVLFDPTRIVVDVGGAPGAVSADGNTAIYAPARGAQVGRTFHLSGAARAFEATYLWRVRDSSGRVVAGAPGTASIGTSALWGSFETDVALPATAGGFVTLEVYQISPKDGSETSLAGAHLAIRP